MTMLSASELAMNPDAAIIRKQVRGVEFGLYTDKDVRERSVKEIVSPLSFLEGSESPLPKGLYDPAMGPSSAKDKMPCPTCAGRFLVCPGHFGHIELCVPLYQPMLFAELLKLLGLKCFYCHKVRAPPRQIKIAYCKLLLLKHYRLVDFEELDARLSQAIEHEHQDTENTKGETEKVIKQRVAGAAMDKILEPLIVELESKVPPKETNTAAKSAQRVYQNLLKKDWKAVAKCQHCGAFSPKLRHDQYNKIFQAALSEKSKRMNASDDIVMKSALEYQQERAKKRKNQKATAKDRTDGYDSEDTDVGDRPSNMMIDDEAEEAPAPMEQDDSDDDSVDSGLGKKKKANPVTASKKQDAVNDRFYMSPSEVMAQVELVWEHHGKILGQIFFGGTYSWDVFFCQAIPVPPNRFRPLMVTGGMAVEHSQTQNLAKMINENANVREHLFGSQPNERLAHGEWIKLQTIFNCFLDNTKDPTAHITNPALGVRQLLEKKEGIFRKHMMGKRVDYACRSVISPDPYVGTNEIGIPLHFAKTLTYPTPVTELNVVEMRKLVERGADNYPGARWVEVQGKRIDLSHMNEDRRKSVAALLLKMDGSKSIVKPAIVGRQLRHGDTMLVNRQPTLHKPGIMAHQVRILHNPTQKTIRMHYANCNTYNADFDGDEMNCHFPQSDVARAEALYIAQTDLQYIVPTDGSPLRGLIQDHVCGGVKLTTRDTFLKRWEYQQLLFASLASLPRLELIESYQEIQLVPPAILKPEPLWTGKQVITTLLLHLCNSPRGRKNAANDKHEEAETDMLRKGGLSLERKAKTPESAFGASHEEHLVLIRDGELLRGILDKSAFGATDFSLVHGIYEAFGPAKAGLLLNALGRLFTAYIQYYSGHSCRMEDLVLTPQSDKARRDLVQRAYNLGTRACKAWADSEGGKVPIEPVSEKEGANQPLKPVEVAAASAKIGQLLGGPQGAENFAALDGFMMSQLNPLASDIIKECLPNGLAVPFPANTFGLMTTTGAKGSIVNQSQVTCALGQQALEGRRVPRMNSGRTLPSFAPYDLNPRADGFVMDRFLTGVRPQEYYFHCMAGREGLVDTAVKTSRSGYLQRCLVKHLEELKVCYDFTVRNSEGGVVQFLYGEDGMDPTKASYLDCTPSTFEYFARNHNALQLQNTPLPGSSIDIAAADSERYESLANCDPLDDRYSPQLLSEGMFVQARKLRHGAKWVRGALCQGWFNAIVTKVYQEGNYFDLKYLKDNSTVSRMPRIVNLGVCGGRTESAISSMCLLIKPAAADPIISSTAGSIATSRGSGAVHRLGSSGSCVSERVASSAMKALDTKRLDIAMKAGNLTKRDVGRLVAAKYGTALCAPGEAVGSIAAQSVGEPSTQMTLNTFHLAGAGANVTLGIPRLREIIMTASRKLKTPTMSIPLLDNVSDKKATKLTRSFQKLTLMELIAGHKGVKVTETLMLGDTGEWQRAYHVTLKLHPEERIKAAFGLLLEDVALSVERKFVPVLKRSMKDELKRSATEGDIVSPKVEIGASMESVGGGTGDEEGGGRQSKKGDADEFGDEDDDDDSDDEAGEEDGVTAMKNKSAEDKELSYGNADDDDESTENNQQSMDEDDNMEDADVDAPQTPSGKRSVITVGSGLKVDRNANTITMQPFVVEPSARPLLMVGLVEKTATKTLVQSRKNIDQAFVNKEDGRGRCLQTAGINFEEMWRLDERIVDHNRLMSNDIWAIRCAYGVEAARNNIGEQIRSVFGAYGIEVDPRHLSLIADYMTYEGGYKAMNRIGMEEMSSTLLQMSFETTAHFLTQAARNGLKDELESPSANIVLGQPIKHGTGCFDLLAKAS